MKLKRLPFVFAIATFIFGAITLWRLSFIGTAHKALIGMYSGFPGRNGDHMYYTSMALQFAGKSYNQSLQIATNHFHDYPLSPESLNFGFLDTSVAPLIYARQSLAQLLSIGYRLFGTNGFGLSTLVIGILTTYLLIRWVAREWGSTAAWATLMLASASTFYLWYSTGIFIETIVLLIEVLWLYTLPISKFYKASSWNLLATNLLIALLALTRQFPVLPVAVLAAGWFATYLQRRKVRNSWFLPAILGSTTSLVSYLLVNFWAPYSPAGEKAKHHFSLTKSLHYLISILEKDPAAIFILVLAIIAFRRFLDRTLGMIAIAVFLSCAINLYLTTTEYRYWMPVFIYALPLAGLALTPSHLHFSSQKAFKYRCKLLSVLSGASLAIVLITALIHYGSGNGKLVTTQHIEYQVGRKTISGEIVCYSNSGRTYLERAGKAPIALTGTAMAHNPMINSAQDVHFQSIRYGHILDFLNTCLALAK